MVYMSAWLGGLEISISSYLQQQSLITESSQELIASYPQLNFLDYFTIVVIYPNFCSYRAFIQS